MEQNETTFVAYLIIIYMIALVNCEDITHFDDAPTYFSHHHYDLM